MTSKLIRGRGFSFSPNELLMILLEKMGRQIPIRGYIYLRSLQFRTFIPKLAVTGYIRNRLIYIHGKIYHTQIKLKWRN